MPLSCTIPARTLTILGSASENRRKPILTFGFDPTHPAAPTPFAKVPPWVYDSGCLGGRLAEE
jgi:hypothetical protein